MGYVRLRVLAWTQRRCYIIIIDNEQICSQSLRQSPGTYLLLLLLLTHARSNTSLGHVEWDHSLGTDRWGRQRLNDAMTSGPILLLTASPWKDRAHASPPSSSSWPGLNIHVAAAGAATEEAAKTRERHLPVRAILRRQKRPTIEAKETYYKEPVTLVLNGTKKHW